MQRPSHQVMLARQVVKQHERNDAHDVMRKNHQAFFAAFMIDPTIIH